MKFDETIHTSNAACHYQNHYNQTLRHWFFIFQLCSIIVETVELLCVAHARPRNFCYHSKVQSLYVFVLIASIHSANRKMNRYIQIIVCVYDFLFILIEKRKLISHIFIFVTNIQTKISVGDERAINNTTAGSSAEDESDDEEDHKDTHDEVVFFFCTHTYTYNVMLNGMSRDNRYLQLDNSGICPTFQQAR